MFYLNSNLNFGVLPVLVFQLEVYYKVDRLLTGLTAKKGTAAWWYLNKTSLLLEGWYSIKIPLHILWSMRKKRDLKKLQKKYCKVFCDST